MITLELVRNSRVFHVFYVLFIVAAEILSNQYALVEFEAEECTAVVSFQRIFCSDLETIQRGDMVKVLWNDKRDYLAKFILSGMFLPSKFYLMHNIVVYF